MEHKNCAYSKHTCRACECDDCDIFDFIKPSVRSQCMMSHVMNGAHRQRILDDLRRELDTDLLGVDAKWLLFGMAMQSYRYESLLLPYPLDFCSANGYNINALHITMGTMPDFNTIHHELLNNVLSTEQLELLHWLLVESGTPKLHHLTRNEQLLLWRKLGQKPQPLPQLVFRVDAGNGPNAEPYDVTSSDYYSGDMEELYRLLASPEERKLLQLNKLHLESERDKSLDSRRSDSIKAGSSIFSWLSSKLNLIVFVGVFTFASYRLRPWA